MQRREFLKAAGAASVAATLAPRTIADDAAGKSGAVRVQRDASDRFRLEFSPAEPRPMRVLQITDTHFGTDSAEGRAKDARSFADIKQMIDRHRPDFIVHTGDFINNDQGPQVSFEAIEFFDDLNVPWTHALGNHDHGARPVPEFRKLMKHAAVGEFRGDDGDEYAFRLDVHRAGQSSPDCTLFCFNSGYKEPDRKVDRAQLEWFANQMRRDAEQQIASPALAMIHIPVIEFEKLRPSEAYRGNYGERVCFDSDSGDTFAQLDRSPRIRAVFSGHDHDNDYFGVWSDVQLVYGRVSGWGGYGDLPRGGRMIEIDLADGSFTHRLVFPDS